MKTVLSALLLSASMFAAPAAFAVDETISPLCRDGADAVYQRPGGYCDQVGANKSLASPGEGGCPLGQYFDIVDDERVCVSQSPV